jgi:hypothetical protein
LFSRDDKGSSGTLKLADESSERMSLSFDPSNESRFSLRQALSFALVASEIDVASGASGRPPRGGRRSYKGGKGTCLTAFGDATPTLMSADHPQASTIRDRPIRTRLRTQSACVTGRRLIPRFREVRPDVEAQAGLLAV